MTPERAQEFTPERRAAFNGWFLEELAWEIRMKREVLPEGYKRCICCKRVLPEAEHFPKRSDGIGRNTCIGCRREQVKQYQRKYYAANREKYSAYYKSRRAAEKGRATAS